jgi:peptide/nickel transport system permease protein
MTRYIARRVLQVVPVVFGVSVTVFLMLRLIPGDVVSLILGNEGAVNPERAEQMRTLFGLPKVSSSEKHEAPHGPLAAALEP